MSTLFFKVFLITYLIDRTHSCHINQKNQTSASAFPNRLAHLPNSALGYRPPAPEIIVPREELPMNHEAA
jgi:hypothetical protein